MSLSKTATCDKCKKTATVWVLWAEGMAVIPACDSHKQGIADSKGDDFVGFRPMGWRSKIVEFSPALLTAMHSVVDNTFASKELPKYTLDGDEITSVKELAVAMGVDAKVAALYALERKRIELADEALSLLSGPNEMKNLSVERYIREIIGIKPEKKRVRLVRTVLGARRFSQPRGSIIVTDGQAPLDNIMAAPNDVRGYDKVTDSKGRIFYIGEEANRWVVRAPGQQEPLFVGDSDRDAYYWLNDAVVGKKPGKKKK